MDFFRIELWDKKIGFASVCKRSENFFFFSLLLEEGELEVLLHQNLIQMPHKNKQVMHAKLQQLSRKLGTNEVEL